MEHLVIWLPNVSDVPNGSLSRFKRGAGGSQEETSQTLDERAEQKHFSQLLFFSSEQVLSAPASGDQKRSSGMNDPT